MNSVIAHNTTESMRMIFPCFVALADSLLVRRYIEIDFKDEVGHEKGSWKGGVMGCSYDLLPDESPMDCIKRMEKERRF